ncbi:MAG: IclR family transcriptional regulator [Ilumatobacteraceae bacterium]
MDSVSGVGVIDKGVAILDALADGPLDLIGLQAATGLPRATAHRLVVALETHHLVRRDPAGRFCLGFELIRLGRAAADEFPLAELATPALVSLRDLTGESVQLFVRDGSGRRCVASLQSPHALQWIVPVGALLPLELGSAGRVLTGAHLAESVEERERGVASVSAAVVDASGATVAALSISGPVERMTRAPRRRFGRPVSDAAERLSALVAGRG